MTKRNVLAVSWVLISLVLESWASAGFIERGVTILGGANFDSRSASFADIDGDRDLDLFFQGASGAQQLFRNNFIGSGTLNYTKFTSSDRTSTLPEPGPGLLTVVWLTCCAAVSQGRPWRAG